MASPSPQLLDALTQVPKSSDPPAALSSLLANLKSLSQPSTLFQDLCLVLQSVLDLDGSSTSLNLGVVAQRALLSDLASALGALGDPDLTIKFGQHALNALASAQTSSNFLDQAATIRELVASAHEENEDWLESARILADMPLDSSQRKVTNTDRVGVWVRIVRNYLEADDTTAAETYLNKIKNVIYTVDDPALQLHFRLSDARIQDAKRNFLPASQAYHNISFSPAISDEERIHTLGMAVKCAILAPAGPQRRRALGRLFKDERSPQLPEFGFLEKMFFDRLLDPAEVDKFAQNLAPHQLAITADGSTVLSRAVVEHNLLSASRLYANISFAALGALLGLDSARAEETTARMIEQGRLSGRIDQIDEFIYFDGVGTEGGAAGAGAAGDTAEGPPASRRTAQEMRRWDTNVQGLAEEVENVTNALQREFPEFVAQTLVV